MTICTKQLNWLCATFTDSLGLQSDVGDGAEVQGQSGTVGDGRGRYHTWTRPDQSRSSLSRLRFIVHVFVPPQLKGTTQLKTHNEKNHRVDQLSSGAGAEHHRGLRWTAAAQDGGGRGVVAAMLFTLVPGAECQAEFTFLRRPYHTRRCHGRGPGGRGPRVYFVRCL